VLKDGRLKNTITHIKKHGAPPDAAEAAEEAAAAVARLQLKEAQQPYKLLPVDKEAGLDVTIHAEVKREQQQLRHHSLLSVTCIALHPPRPCCTLCVTSRAPFQLSGKDSNSGRLMHSDMPSEVTVACTAPAPHAYVLLPCCCLCRGPAAPRVCCAEGRDVHPQPV